MKSRTSEHVLVTLSLAAFVAAGATACTSTSSTSPSTSNPVATSGPAHTTLDGTAFFARSEPVVSSNNGAFLAKKATGGGFTFEAADGRVVRTVKDYKHDFGGFSTCGFSLKGVSDDGRFVTIGGCATDPGRVLGARYIYDVEANRHVLLPEKAIDAIIFVDNTTVVLHGGDGSGVQSLILMSVTGEVITKLPDASATFRTTFIGYTPRS